MTLDKQEPLWRLMQNAYDQSSVPDELLESADAYDCLTDRYGYAAEIRALRDRILPPEPPVELPEYPDPIEAASWGGWKARENLRALLTAEAERAEKGE